MTLDSHFQTLDSIAISTCNSVQNLVTTAQRLQMTYIAYLDSIFLRFLLHMTTIFLDSITLMCTLLKNIIIFMIQLTIGTWTCLSVLLFNALAVFALNACQTLINWVNAAIDDAITAVNTSLAALSKVVNSVSGLINSITSLISHTSSSISDVQLSLSGIQNMTIPSSVSDNIESLKDKLPSYDSIMNETSNLISTPFELIEKEMDIFKSSVAAKVSNLNYNVTSVSSTSICNATQIDDIVDRGEKVIRTSTNVFSALLGASIIVLLLYYLYTTVKAWRRLEFVCSITQQYPLVSRDIEIMNLANLASRGSVQLYLQTVVQKRWAQNVQMCWWLNYVFSNRLSLVLEIGLFGILISILEMVIYNGFAKIVKQLSGILTKETLSLSALAVAGLESWESNTNSRISTVEDYTNDQVLSWVRTGSEAVNGTLTTMMNKISTALTDALGDSSLESIASGVVDCTIGNKVTKVEQGLTWIHNKSTLTLPRLNSVNSTSVSSAIVNSSDQLSSAGVKISALVRKQIMIELGISCGFLGLWILVCAAAYIYAVVYSAEECETQSIEFEEKK